jgi:hypothetical protein
LSDHEKGIAAMTRSAQEVFRDHIAALTTGDVAGILADYRDDAVFITADGALDGLAGIENFYTQAIRNLPNLELATISATYAPNALLLVWSGSSPAGKIENGVDTFVFEAGKISIQTTLFKVTAPDGPDSGPRRAE